MKDDERFFAKVVFSDGECWRWTGYCNPDGYGIFSIRGKVVSAHRWSYERHVGPILPGHEIDHLCRVRCCVNPEHLECVTHTENMRRSAPAAKKVCANGHPYDEENTYVRPSGHRDCRACVRERVRRYNSRKKVKAA